MDSPVSNSDLPTAEQQGLPSLAWRAGPGHVGVQVPADLSRLLVEYAHHPCARVALSIPSAGGGGRARVCGVALSVVVVSGFVFRACSQDFDAGELLSLV